MTVYHGGLEAISSPRVIKGDRIGDFGMGFYTTTDFEQARRFVMRKCIVAGRGRGVISTYSIPDDSLARPELAVKQFPSASEEWVEFVFANRRVALFEHGYDLVYGPVANDQVYASFALFEDGQIGHEELIRRLKSRRLVDQLLFHTEKALTLLKFTASVEVVCPGK